MSRFEDSDKKVKRAKKHIAELMRFLEEFTHHDLYAVSIQRCPWQRRVQNELVVTINEGSEFAADAALIIGDAIHNLRSALDFLWFKIVAEGTDTRQTRFPLFNTREEVERFINGALHQKQITSEVYTFTLDTVKPYEAGNFPLWGLKELNDRDKHKLLIPTFKVMSIRDIRLRNKEKIIPIPREFFTCETLHMLLDESIFGICPEVEDKGNASTDIGFQFRIPFQNEAVIPTLNRISEEVSRTIESFKILLEV